MISAFFEKYQINDTVIAVAVSGGADSLALVWQLKNWIATKGQGRRLVALTVDHGLRPESRSEADYVASLMAGWGVEHHILTWEGIKPVADVEAAAREARYALLADWCLAHQVAVLAVGHHMQDQAETFLLRLVRGSGLYGLSGMLPVSNRLGLKIIRPLLEQKPEDLRRLLNENGIKWCEDASNKNDVFDRVKMRQYLPELEAKIGLSRERLAATAAVLARSRSLVEDLAAKMIKNQVEDWLSVAKSLSLRTVAEMHEELRYRVLATLVMDVGHRAYTPEADEMLRLCVEVIKPDFKGCTLGDCEMFAEQGKLWIIPQLKEKFVLSVSDWEAFAATHTRLVKKSLPHKLRQALYLQLAK